MNARGENQQGASCLQVRAGFRHIKYATARISRQTNSGRVGQASNNYARSDSASRVANRRPMHHARAPHAPGLGAEGSSASGGTGHTRDPPGPDIARLLQRITLKVLEVISNLHANVVDVGVVAVIDLRPSRDSGLCALTNRVLGDIGAETREDRGTFWEIASLLRTAAR